VVSIVLSTSHGNGAKRVATWFAVPLILLSAACGSSNKPGGNSGGSAGQSIADPHEVCILEALAGLNYLLATTAPDLNGNAGITSLAQLIGGSSRFFLTAVGVFGQYHVDLVQNGQANAQSNARGDADSKCAEANNPVLNRDQLNSLKSTLDDSQVAVLDRVNYFG
jgi:hypothetical protein